MLRAHALGWMLLTLLVMIGCNSRPTRIKPPAIDPQQAGRQALVEYDTNGDGTIDGAEFEKSPALKAALTDIDKNGDDKISADEIAQRIEIWQASKVGIIAFNCRVLLDRAPLVGATVTLVPEKFLGPNVLPASGTTSDQGYAVLSIDKDNMPAPNLSGVHVGLYRVEISKQQNGKESIPADYNVNSKLGQEVSQGNESMLTGVKYDLKSR